MFTVTATGTAPLHYQWRFSGTNLGGATVSSYTRANVQPAHRGSYSVVVSNAAGSVTSVNAALQLIVPSPLLAMPAPGRLQWLGLSNLGYTVQSRTNLVIGNWQVLGSTSSPDGVLIFTLPNLGVSQQFYRVACP
jgi:hypothetical protein